MRPRSSARMRLGGRRDQVAHLIERLGPALARRGPSDAQNPHGFDVSVPRLGLATGVAREGGPSSREMASWGSDFPCAAAAGGWGDRLRPRGHPRLGSAGSARHHRTRSPRHRPARRGRSHSASQAASCSQLLGGGEALDAEEGSSFVQSRSYVDVEVCIDPAGDAPCQIGHCHPFVGLGWGDTAPSGTTDNNSDGPVSGRLLLGHSVRPAGVEWVTGPGRWIVRRTVPRDVSRFFGVRPGLGTHPHADQLHHRSGG